MTDIRLLGRAVVGTVFAATMLVPGAVSAATGEVAGPSSIKLTVTEFQNRESRTVMLVCDPASGNHPHASVACQELLRVDGQFERLDPGQPKSCTKERRKVDAAAEGTWRGRDVGYRATLANPCALKAATGSVFDF